MNDNVALEFVNLFCAGLLAGSDVVVRLGVAGPLAALGEPLQIELRQALIRTLRVLVPALYLPTAVTAVAITVLDGDGPGVVFRAAGLLAVLTWTGLTFGGTVPINRAALGWACGAPPVNWRAMVARWERLDTWRTVAAVAAFGAFLAAAAAGTAAR